MSCEACQAFQDSGATSCFRWKNANVEVRACEQHLTEVFDVLRRAQEQKALMEAALELLSTAKAIAMLDDGDEPFVWAHPHVFKRLHRVIEKAEGH